MPDEVALGDDSALKDVGHGPFEEVDNRTDVLGFEIHARFVDGSVRLSCGERVKHRWLQDAESLAKRTMADHPSLGSGVEVLVDGPIHDDQWARGLGQAQDLEVELVGLGPDTLQRALKILGFALSDDQAARGVLKLADAPFLGWASPWGVELWPDHKQSTHDDPAQAARRRAEVERLSALGAKGLDLRLATHRLDGVYFCLRNVRAVYSDRWLVAIWGEPMGPKWKEYAGYQALPGRGGVRPYPGRTTSSAFNGSARFARLIQDIVWHNAWSAETLGAEIEAWEERFYCAATTPGEGGSAETAELQTDLAWLGQFVGQLHTAARTMSRRLRIRDEFPEAIRDEVERCCNELEEKINGLRQHVRDGFSLLTSVSGRQQAEIAEQRQLSDRRFQLTAGLVTAAVLVPGLVAAFYGANVQGLPGQNGVSGLWYMLGAAVAGALVTLALILMSLRRPARSLRPSGDDRPPLPRPTVWPKPSSWPRGPE